MRTPAPVAVMEAVRVAKSLAPRAAGLVNAVLRRTVEEPWPDPRRSRRASVAATVAPRVAGRALGRAARRERGGGCARGRPGARAAVPARGGERPRAAGRGRVRAGFPPARAGCPRCREGCGGGGRRAAGREGLRDRPGGGGGRATPAGGRRGSPRTWRPRRAARAWCLRASVRASGWWPPTATSVARCSCGATWRSWRRGRSRRRGRRLRGAAETGQLPGRAAGRPVLRHRHAPPPPGDPLAPAAAADLPGLAAGQRRLAEAAAALLAPGGVLLYATCSLEPEENAAVVAGLDLEVLPVAPAPPFRALPSGGAVIPPEQWGMDSRSTCCAGGRERRPRRFGVHYSRRGEWPRAGQRHTSRAARGCRLREAGEWRGKRSWWSASLSKPGCRRHMPPAPSR